MKAINIEWDVDDEEDLMVLPTELDIPDGMTDEDEITDYLSEVTGFCHYGCDLVDDDYGEKTNMLSTEVPLSEISIENLQQMLQQSVNAYYREVLKDADCASETKSPELRAATELVNDILAELERRPSEDFYDAALGETETVSDLSLKGLDDKIKSAEGKKAKSDCLVSEKDIYEK